MALGQAGWYLERRLTLRGLTAGQRFEVTLFPHPAQASVSARTLTVDGARQRGEAQLDLFGNSELPFQADGERVELLASFHIPGQAALSHRNASNALTDIIFPFSYPAALRRELFSLLRVPTPHPAFDAWLQQHAPASSDLAAVVRNLTWAADQHLQPLPDPSAPTVAAETRGANQIFVQPQVTPIERVWFIATLLRFAGIATRLAWGIALVDQRAALQPWVQLLRPDGTWQDLLPGSRQAARLIVLRLANSPEGLATVAIDGGRVTLQEQISLERPERPAIRATDSAARWDAINRCGLMIDRAFELLDLSVHSASDSHAHPHSARLTGGSNWLAIVEGFCAAHSAQGPAPVAAQLRHIVTDGRGLMAEAPHASAGTVQQASRAAGLLQATAIDLQRRLGLAALFGSAQRVATVPGYPAATLTGALSAGTVPIDLDQQLLALLLQRAVILMNADGRLTGQPNHIAGGRAVCDNGDNHLAARAPHAIWQALQRLSEDLKSHHLPWQCSWLEPLFSAQFPTLGSLRWSQDCEVQLRAFDLGRAIELALLTEGTTDGERWQLQVDGQPVPLLARPGLKVGVLPLDRSQRQRVTLAVVDRWLERPVVTGALSLTGDPLWQEAAIAAAPRSLTDRAASKREEDLPMTRDGSPRKGAWAVA